MEASAQTTLVRLSVTPLFCPVQEEPLSVDLSTNPSFPTASPVEEFTKWTEFRWVDVPVVIRVQVAPPSVVRSTTPESPAIQPRSESMKKTEFKSVETPLAAGVQDAERGAARKAARMERTPACSNRRGIMALRRFDLPYDKKPSRKPRRDRGSLSA